MTIGSHRFLDYEVLQGNREQSRRDLQEGSGNKFMREADNYLKSATASFQLADAFFKETEAELLRMLKRLEKRL
jgi:hypothetical protein